MIKSQVSCVRKQREGFSPASSAAANKANIADAGSSHHPHFNVGDIVTTSDLPEGEALLVVAVKPAPWGEVYRVTSSRAQVLSQYFTCDQLAPYTGFVQLFDATRGLVWLEGDCVNGRLHGRCRMLGSDFVYDGHWCEDYMEGVGALHFFDGSSFEGSFRKGMRHGFGCYTDAEGICTRGYWAYDRLVQVAEAA